MRKQMRQRLSHTLPLLGTFGFLIVAGIVLFRFTPADAVMTVAEITAPPDAIELQPANPDQIQPLDATNSGTITTDTVAGLYFAANDVVVLDGHYLNDVFVAGDSVTVTGTIEGDLFAAGNSVTINGDVNGSVRAAGSRVTVNEHVGRNVMVFAEQFTLGKTAHVVQDILVMGKTAQLAGMVLGNVSGEVAEFTLTGSVAGAVDVVEAAEVEPEPEPFVTPFQVITLILFWIGYLILGLVVLRLCPKFSQTVLQTMRQQPGKSFGWGALLVFVGPLAILITACTVIGLPLAGTAALTLFIIMILSKLFFGAAVGQWILPKANGVVWPFVLGFSLVYLLYHIIGWFGLIGSFIGCVIFGLGMLWASGSIVNSLKHGRNF